MGVFNSPAQITKTNNKISPEVTNEVSNRDPFPHYITLSNRKLIEVKETEEFKKKKKTDIFLISENLSKTFYICFENFEKNSK